MVAVNSSKACRETQLIEHGSSPFGIDNRLAIKLQLLAHQAN